MSEIQPKDMDWIENGVLGIEWSDGHKGIYPIRYLRQHCPCAACTDEWTGELRIKPTGIPMLIAVQDIEAVVGTACVYDGATATTPASIPSTSCGINSAAVPSVRPEKSNANLWCCSISHAKISAVLRRSLSWIV